MKHNILYLHLFFIGIFLNGCDATSATDFQLTQTIPTVSEPTSKSNIEEIKISGDIITTISGGDFVCPRISLNGNEIAYSKVLLEDSENGKTENSEIHLYNFQKQQSFVLLNSKQAKKYAVYASFVGDLEWIGTNKLRAYISDGDVDSTILTFNTQTRRLIKKEFSSDNEDYDRNYPREMESVYLELVKSFPEIPKDVAETAFSTQKAFKIGNKGVVLRFWHSKIDSNIWYFDFQTKKKYLLLERPEIDTESGLVGAFETAGKILFFAKNKSETEFFTFQDGNISQIAKTNLGGGFQPLFSNSDKSIFILKQPNYQSESKSSLWLFDGNKLNEISDVANLCDVNIDSAGKTIAFSFWANENERHISVRKLN